MIKSGKIILLIISYYFLICNSSFCQNNNELRVIISSSDSSSIHGATVYLDGELLSNNGSSYIKSDFYFNQYQNYSIRITHPNYENRTIIILSNNISGNGQTYYANHMAPIPIFKKDDHFFASKLDSIPFEYRPEYIGFWLTRKTDTTEFNNLIDQIGLEKTNDIISNGHLSPNTYYLKKQNGKKFKSKNCKELKVLRNAGIDCGPVLGNGFFSFYITLKIKEGEEDKVIRIMKKYGFKLKEENKKNLSYTFIAPYSMGYEIANISIKLLKHDEITKIIVGTKLPNKLF